MRLWCLVIVVLGACYAPPTEPACAITCVQDCPGDLHCDHGFCVAGTDTCVPSFTTVAAGADFACALDDRQQRWCWGNNAHHQVDPGADAGFAVATRIPSDLAWDSLATGRDHACGLAAGQLWCWGGNEHGQVDGRVVDDIATPVQITVPGITTWTAVSAGIDTTCAIGDGRLYCWGRNEAGQLGDGAGARTDLGAPTEVIGARTDWIAIATNGKHTCGVTQSEGVLCWGHLDSGDLGPTGTTDELVPVVALGPPAKLVAVTQQATCATKGDDSLWCWGEERNGELGEAYTDTMSTAEPHPATLTGGWTRLVAGASSLCGLAGTDAYCWGTAQSGGLGAGMWNDRSGWRHVSPGASDVAQGCGMRELGLSETSDLDLSCAIVDGAAQCWGDNRSGQLARGTTTMSTAPQPVVADHLFSAISTATDHVCGIEGSDVLCWGSTEYGQTTGVLAGNGGDGGFAPTPCVPNLDCDLGAPKPIGFAAGASQLATGNHHTCALIGGRISCWGGNDNSQLGTNAPPAPKPRDVPQVGGAAAWQTLYRAGDLAQCATSMDTLTYCWGNDYRTQSSTPTHDAPYDGASEIVIGPGVGCILDANHLLACYGDDTVGESGNGPLNTGTCGDASCDPGEDPTACPADCGPGPLRPLGRTYKTLAVSASSAGCGITPADEIECWGLNGRGQTGAYSGTALVNPTYFATKVTGLAGCTGVAMGGAHTCGLCSGAVSCWGDNSVAQLGIGPPSPMPTPIPQVVLPASTDDPWLDIHAGNAFTCARSTAGHVSCWGFDPRGALGNGGTGANLPLPVQFR